MEINISGWIDYDCDGNVAVSDLNRLNRPFYARTSIAKLIISECPNSFNTKKGLGGEMGIIPEANLQIYYTDTECTFEEAETAFLESFYGATEESSDGTLVVNIENVGYSEYTITGFNVKEMTIGGHDLEAEIGSHLNEYINMRISY